MFTGIVEEIGETLDLQRSAAGARLAVRAEKILPGLRLGDSVAVNGCCLTLTSEDRGELRFDLLEETVRVTNLADLQPGDSVNLERALAAGGRLGGHFVQGHVDATATVLGFEAVGADHRLEIALAPEFAGLVVRKGSIAVDGVSLTIAEVGGGSFVVWIIPRTLAETNLRSLRARARVNLEFDLLAKHLERMLSLRGLPSTGG